MNQSYPVPPPELLEQWSTEANRQDCVSYTKSIAIDAAQWGADQELLACGNYLEKCAAWEPEDVTEFYNYRRPKPPSLKELALAKLPEHPESMASYLSLSPGSVATIRRALEALDD